MPPGVLSLIVLRSLRYRKNCVILVLTCSGSTKKDTITKRDVPAVDNEKYENQIQGQIFLKMFHMEGKPLKIFCSAARC